MGVFVWSFVLTNQYLIDELAGIVEPAGIDELPQL
jgi:hypothetical protein